MNDTDVTKKDAEGKSVLMYALKKGSIMGKIIDTIIDAKKYDDKDNNGCSAFMYACSGGYMPAVKEFVKEMKEKEREEI